MVSMGQTFYAEMLLAKAGTGMISGKDARMLC